MPELPEVETVARQLDPLVRGQRIRQFETPDPLLKFKDHADVTGSRIPAVRRIGKEVVFILERDDHRQQNWYLAVHLRMTGRLIYAGKAQPELARGEKHLRATLTLDKGKVLFHDMRRFGTIKLFRCLEDVQPAGDEPLERKFSARRISALIRDSRMEIKTWLLRQDRICGIGNIYASEILYDCGIDPFRPAASLTEHEQAELVKSIKKILRKAIRHCGTTFSDFQNANGEVGGYQKYLCVYQHAGDGCGRCGTEILRDVQAQRSTFWCPACQR